MEENNPTNLPLLLRLSMDLATEDSPLRLLTRMTTPPLKKRKIESSRELNERWTYSEEGSVPPFQASMRVASELEKWIGASEKDKPDSEGKALDPYLAEINLFMWAIALHGVYESSLFGKTIYYY